MAIFQSFEIGKINENKFGQRQSRTPFSSVIWIQEKSMYKILIQKKSESKKFVSKKFVPEKCKIQTISC